MSYDPRGRIRAYMYTNIYIYIYTRVLEPRYSFVVEHGWKKSHGLAILYGGGRDDSSPVSSRSRRHCHEEMIFLQHASVLAAYLKAR